MKVLVTGANGFIGSSLVPKLEAVAHVARSAVRQDSGAAQGKAVGDLVCIGNIDSSTRWDKALVGVDVVIHLAARVHVMHETTDNPLDAFRKVNVQGTLNLARQAAEAGVKRFIYVSSIKVNGDRTLEFPYTDDDIPAPVDPYAISKHEAEKTLLEFGRVSGMDVVIVRPPLVYGSAVGGNFKRLMQLIERGIPLPFASIRNARSMVSVQNLVDFLIRCLEHPKAAGEIFLVADGKDWSTPELIRSIAREMNVPAHLFSFPLSLLNPIAHMAGQGQALQRLCYSLVVDISKAREYLDWTPPQSPDDAVHETVKWYLRHKHA